jgi:hypothetical protein
MNEPGTILPLTGFDPEGEPEIRVQADGSWMLVFNFMPPSWAEDEPEPFDDFDKQLGAAIGQEVLWDDREFFRIPRPGTDTRKRIQQFLVQVRRASHP